MLADLLGDNDIGLPIIYSEHLIGNGREMFKHATKLNFEGIVSKNARAPYRSDRNEGWVKVKTVQSPSSDSSRTPPESLPCISGNERAKTSSIWVSRDRMIPDYLKPN